MEVVKDRLKMQARIRVDQRGTIHRGHTDRERLEVQEDVTL